MSSHTRIASMLLFAMTLLLVHQGSIDGRVLQQQTTSNTLMDAISNNPDLSVLGEALKAYPQDFEASLTDSNTNWTVFAPNNAALLMVMQQLGIGSWQGAVNSVPIVDILKYHVVSGAVKSTDLMHGMKVPTLQGGRVIVDLVAAASPIIRGRNSAGKVVQADVQAGNSVVHVVDKVLLPINPFPVKYKTIAELAVAGNLTTLLAAVEKANLTSSLTDPNAVLTVFAPTNEALSTALAALGLTLESIPVATLQKVLLYHVAPGYGPTARMVGNGQVNTLLNQTLTFSYPDMNATMPMVIANMTNATIILGDGFCGESVVHVVDTVLVPNLHM